MERTAASAPLVLPATLRTRSGADVPQFDRPLTLLEFARCFCSGRWRWIDVWKNARYERGTATPRDVAWASRLAGPHPLLEMTGQASADQRDAAIAGQLATLERSPAASRQSRLDTFKRFLAERASNGRGAVAGSTPDSIFDLLDDSAIDAELDALRAGYQGKLGARSYRLAHDVRAWEDKFSAALTIRYDWCQQRAAFLQDEWFPLFVLQMLKSGKYDVSAVRLGLPRAPVSREDLAGVRVDLVKNVLTDGEVEFRLVSISCRSAENDKAHQKTGGRRRKYNREQLKKIIARGLSKGEFTRSTDRKIILARVRSKIEVSLGDEPEDKTLLSAIGRIISQQQEGLVLNSEN